MNHSSTSSESEGRARAATAQYGSDSEVELAGLLACVPRLYERLMALFENLQTPRRGRVAVLRAFSSEPMRPGQVRVAKRRGALRERRVA